jgi:sensor histidine kinase regulating citrate/malate metabolism
MVKFYKSLQWKLTASFVILILLITALTYVYTYSEAKKALKDTIKDQLRMTADLAASQFTPEMIDTIVSLKTGDDSRSDYNAINLKLYDMRKNNPDISEFYGMRKEGDNIVFIFDDWTISTPDDCSLIGDVYVDYDPVLLEAFEGKNVASEDFYTDEWGTWLTGYAPLRDKDGVVIAVLAVDMKVDTVQEKINFIGSLIYVIMGAAVLLAGLLILFFSATIIKDINKMTKVANKISSGDMAFELPEIKSKNEIYELNEGLKSVVAAVEFLKSEAETKNKPSPPVEVKKAKKSKPKKSKKGKR